MSDISLSVSPEGLDVSSPSSGRRRARIDATPSEGQCNQRDGVRGARQQRVSTPNHYCADPLRDNQ
jgi:hypothetical protein